jgi:hypothetical protein
MGNILVQLSVITAVSDAHATQVLLQEILLKVIYDTKIVWADIRLLILLQPTGSAMHSILAERMNY